MNVQAPILFLASLAFWMSAILYVEVGVAAWRKGRPSEVVLYATLAAVFGAIGWCLWDWMR